MRQFYVAGSAHLLTTLADETATPGDLAASVRTVAKLFQVLVLEGLASDITAPTLDAVNKYGEVVHSLCKRPQLTH